MNYIKINLFLILLIAFLIPDVAQADIFDDLAKKAEEVGKGLKDTGYLIAGLGLIAITGSAIFGKVSWKTVGYLMMSCFILTYMVYLIDWVRGENTQVAEIEIPAGNDGNASAPGNVDANKVSK